MATYNGKPAGDINHAMKQYLPETAGCNYADYPMNFPRWLNPKDKAPDGKPCFLQTSNSLPAEGIKVGYVWGPGNLGFGYYHLLTQHAHKTLFTRISHRRVNIGPDSGGGGGCCGCFGEVDPRTKMPSGVSSDDIDDLRLIFHARSVASVPNDGQARQDALGEAKTTANAHYQFDQNIVRIDSRGFLKQVCHSSTHLFSVRSPATGYACCPSHR